MNIPQAFADEPREQQHNQQHKLTLDTSSIFATNHTYRCITLYSIRIYPPWCVSTCRGQEIWFGSSQKQTEQPPLGLVAVGIGTLAPVLLDVLRAQTTRHC